MKAQLDQRAMLVFFYLSWSSFHTFWWSPMLRRVLASGDNTKLPFCHTIDVSHDRLPQILNILDSVCWMLLTENIQTDYLCLFCYWWKKWRSEALINIHHDRVPNWASQSHWWDQKRPAVAKAIALCRWQISPEKKGMCIETGWSSLGKRRRSEGSRVIGSNFKGRKYAYISTLLRLLLWRFRHKERKIGPC